MRSPQQKKAGRPAKGARSDDPTFEPIIPQKTLTDLFDRGFVMTPLHKGTKQPIPDNWPDKPISDLIEAKKYDPCDWGIICGERSGILVVDVDPPGFEILAGWEADHGKIGTLVQRTPRGGYHYIFQYISGFKNTAKSGIDVRTDRGHIKAAPSEGYHFDDWEAPILPMPAWLIQWLTDHGYTKDPPREDHPMLIHGIHKIRSSVEGSRNDTLNQVAYTMGDLIRKNEIAREVVERELMTAARSVGLEDSEINATIRSGIDSGIDKPRPEKTIKAPTVESDKKPEKWTQAKIKLWITDNWSVQLDESRDVVELDGIPITDIKWSEIMDAAYSVGINNKEKVQAALITLAAQRSYHPIKGYLEKAAQSFAGDGMIHQFANDHFILEDPNKQPYWGTFLRKWMIGAVAKVIRLDPRDTYQNFVLVMDGAQGLGKSRFARWICPPIQRLFQYGSLNPDGKDDLIRMTNALIWEISEFGVTAKRTDREALKRVITQEEVVIRKPYGRYDTYKPTTTSFIATINNIAGYLHDPSGHRRFACFTFAKIDMDEIAKHENRDVLWGEAYHAYMHGEQHYMTPTEETMSAEFAQEYVRETDEDIIINKLFVYTGNDQDFISSSEIAAQIKIHFEGYTVHKTAVDDALARMGAVNKRTSTARGWRKIILRQNYCPNVTI